MATQVQYRRGTDSQNAAFTGALGEITVDTTNGTLRVHDGITAGGSNIATVSYVTAQISALSSNSITDGTSNVRVYANGNVATSVAGTANVLLVQSSGVLITGNLSVTGNATLSGNILGDRIQNGTTTIDIQTANGNANISVAGTTNVAVFASTGAFITGVNSVSGNIDGGNLRTAGLISATGAITGAAITGASLTVSTGNITGGNLILSGAIIDSAQLDIQTSAANANVVITPNGTGNLNVTTGVSITGNVTAGNIYGTLRTAAQTSITSVGTLSSLAVTANIDGGNLRTTGLISATGAITGAAITGSSLTVSTGNVSCGNIVNTNANGVGNIGSASLYFNTVFAKATSAQYADLAEMYESDIEYAPGIVVEFGGSKEITSTTTSHSTAVAGIISTNPSYLMNAAQPGDKVLAVALVGRVPCRVVGTIRKGDRLVSSDVPGAATVLNSEQYQPGCIVAKALEDYDSAEVGIIEVAVGRT